MMKDTGGVLSRWAEVVKTFEGCDRESQLDPPPFTRTPDCLARPEEAVDSAQ